MVEPIGNTSLLRLRDPQLPPPCRGLRQDRCCSRRIFEDNADFFSNPNNPANWKAHRRYDRSGIWAQTGGRSTHFVATNGNQWNGDGCRRGLKERWWQQIYEHTYVARGAGERRDGKPEEVER